MNDISRHCYDKYGKLLPDGFDGSFNISTFSISNSKNKFTAIGCDTSGSIQITDKNSVPNDGSCSGIGCHQLYISAKSFSKHANITDLNPCSYAFVVEDGAFNFSTTYLYDADCT
ncbi:Wall-associated receptor kinase 2 [Camellia lanceoleosa]|uniref:Wall-associated receptor kinase 2 n=1 Tax=Camellia lanceoleosa TaxID=1840588 RepID=A0ACC0HR55_9ERIC|nr:Wall-associated receptor kinase 2 [Camellia lanceoleosa]